MILKHLYEEKMRNAQKTSFLEKRIANAPKGTLRISGAKGRKQYYYRKNKDDKFGSYIPLSNIQLAKDLAQKAYDEKMLKVLEAERPLLDDLIEMLEKNSRGLVFEELSEQRRNLIEKHDLSDKEYSRQWQAVQYKGKGWRDGDVRIDTARGDVVRSKSEMIIADKLSFAGIPYRYEYPHVMASGEIIYSDFTILNVRTREEIIFEHFGKMDDPSYVKTVLWKLNQYFRSGFLLGKNLFASFEGFGYPFDTRMIDRLIAEFMK